MIRLRKDSTYCASGQLDLLHALLDGELPEARRAALLAHVERCGTCAAALQRLTEWEGRLLVARPTPPSLSPAASRALLDHALAEAGAGHRHRGGWLSLACGFAAAVALLATGLSLAWWGPLRGPRAPRTGLRMTAVPGPGPGDVPQVTIDASPAAGVRQTGPPAPRVSGPPRGRPQLPEQRPAKRVEHRLAAPRPDSHATPPHRTRVRPHRFIAEHPPQVHERAPLQPPEPVETPAPGTGEQVAENTPLDPRVVSPLAEAGPPEAAAGEPSEQLDASSAEPVRGTDPRTAADRMEGAGPWLIGSAQSLADTPTTAAPASSPSEDAALTAQAAPPTPRLLVLVASSPAPSPLSVTEAPASAPSYARAMALRPDANGFLTWTQATASDDGTGEKLALVMLGSQFWQLGEEQ